METEVEFFGTPDGFKIAFFWHPNEHSSPRQWENEEYADVLANVMRFSEDQEVFDPNKGVWTCLRNEDGSLRKFFR
jgi:hypothetical protein